MKRDEVGTIPGFNGVLFIKDLIIYVGQLGETSSQTVHVNLRFGYINKKTALDYENIVRAITEVGFFSILYSWAAYLEGNCLDRS